jgi:DNA-3-methyladenine glycosylase II
MFLIFALKRPNIMALNDAGLQRAAKLLYGPKTSLEKLKLKWHPYCSVASWYLWQHLDTKPSVKST